MLADIIGQSYAVSVLTNALESGHIAGSYLFVGPSGTGKYTTALQFTKNLCGAADNNSSAARAIEAGTFPDVRSVAPQPSGILAVGQIWPRKDTDDHSANNAMLRDLYYEPMAGPRRVFIIDGAEGLSINKSSGNSLLKTLEEPPKYAHFILTAASLSGVMPTIVSRCQVVRFGLIDADEIEKYLVTTLSLPVPEARFLSVYSEGRLGLAISLARNPVLLAVRQEILDWTRDLVSAPPIKSFKLSESLRKISSRLTLSAKDSSDEGEEKDKRPRESICRALDLVASYYRDILAVCLRGEGDAKLSNLDRRAEIAEAAKNFRAQDLVYDVDLITSVRHAIERNANTQIAIEALLTRLTLRTVEASGVC